MDGSDRRRQVEVKKQVPRCPDHPTASMMKLPVPCCPKVKKWTCLVCGRVIGVYRKKFP